ncbi:MAG: type II toxin-antitoxin system RelE/ParE family toxin [Actinomycetota bacterium]
MFVSPAAARDLRKLPPEFRGRVRTAIDGLADAPRTGAEKLVGQDAYRIRIGEFRVVFVVDDPGRQVLVVRAKHRRDVYRG